MLKAIFVLDMDGTILSQRTVDVFCNAFNLNDRLKLIDEVSESLPAYRVEEMVAELFKGRKIDEMLGLFNCIPLNEGVEEFIKKLKENDCGVAIATDSYTFLAKNLASRLKVDYVYGLEVEIIDNIFTGKILSEYRCLEIPLCKRFYVCKLWFIRKLKEMYRVPIVSLGDGESDYCMSTGADYPIAVNPKTLKLRKVCKLSVKGFKDLLELDLTHLYHNAEKYLDECKE
jgi:phosphoserine phosphatase